MARFLHVADVHLSGDEFAYSKDVLSEILAKAEETEADAVLVAGHLADDTAPFAKLFAHSTCDWLWNPGASESPSPGPNVRVLDSRPLALTTCAGVEILALPHRNSFADYRSWPVPTKATRRRIGLVHSPVVGMPSMHNDAPGGALDPDLFARFDVDYAALGSGHLTCSPSHHDGTLMADPGSARITSTLETGVRGGFLVDTDEPIQCTWIPFPEAGQRRRTVLPVDTDGSLRDLDTSSWHRNDHVEIHLSGVLHNVDPNAVEQRARDNWQGQVRALEIDTRRLNPVTDPKLIALARRLNDSCTHDQPAQLAREQSLTLLVTAG